MNTQNTKKQYDLKDGSFVSFVNSSESGEGKVSLPYLKVLVPLEHAHFEISWEDEEGEIETKPLTSGDVCIIPAHLPHEVKWVKRSHAVAFYISKEFLATTLKDEVDINEVVFGTTMGVKDTFIINLSRMLKNMMVAQCSPKGGLLESSFIVLSHYIYTHYVLEIEQTTLVSTIEQIPCDKIKVASMFMTNNLDKNLSVEEIAMEAGMSPYYFVRKFKEMMGASPVKLHMMYRMEEAKKQLTESNKSIAEISYDLGFSSQAHFSKTFGQHFGDTPKKFRLSS